MPLNDAGQLQDGIVEESISKCEREGTGEREREIERERRESKPRTNNRA